MISGMDFAAAAESLYLRAPRPPDRRRACDGGRHCYFYPSYRLILSQSQVRELSENPSGTNTGVTGLNYLLLSQNTNSNA